MTLAGLRPVACAFALLVATATVVRAEDPTPTATSTPEATIAATPGPTATAVVPPHLDDPSAAKNAAVCQAGLDAAALTYGDKALDGLGKCVTALSRCVQTKASDQGCLDKAAGTCTKELAKRTVAAQKLEADAAKRCDKVSLLDLASPAGLDFASAAATCAADFGAPLDSVAGLARCVAAQQGCASADLFEPVYPRAAQLLGLVGIAAPPCLDDLGGADALGDLQSGKRLDDCQRGVAKAARSFGSKTRKALAKCTNGVMKCVQTKPDDAKCLEKARKACANENERIDGETIALDRTIADKCAAVDPAALLVPNGGNASGLAGICADAGVPGLVTLDDYATCVARRVRCRVESSVGATAPRMRELLELGGATPSPFCTGP